MLIYLTNKIIGLLNFEYTQSTIFWHETGHFLFRNEVSAAIYLENEYRSIFYLNDVYKQRGFDEEHQKNKNFIWNINLFLNY